MKLLIPFIPHLANECLEIHNCKINDNWPEIKENLREKIRLFTFKPKMTKTQYSWLSTMDINQVMQQYQEYDKNFK